MQISGNYEYEWITSSDWKDMKLKMILPLIAVFQMRSGTQHELVDIANLGDLS